MKQETKTLLVGLTTNYDTGNNVLVVAARSPLSTDVTPINIIKGKEALELWGKLINAKETENGRVK